MKNKKIIFTILVTYNPDKWYKKCLNSLEDSETTIKTIVVDNHSTDGTPQKIREQYPNVDFIELKENTGFAKANNIGLKKAYENGGDYFFLLNQDAWIEPQTIKKLVSVAEANSDFGILSPIHLNGSGELLDWNFTKYISDPSDHGRKLYSDLLLKNKLDQIYKVNYVNAAAWLISRDCIQKVGLFENVLIKQYGEDTNYLQRLHYHKLKIGVFPNAFIYHDREERSGTVTKTNLLHETFIQRFILKGLNILDPNAVSWMEDQIRFEKKRVLKNLLKLNFSKSVDSYKYVKQMNHLFPKIIERRQKYLKNGTI